MERDRAILFDRHAPNSAVAAALLIGMWIWTVPAMAADGDGDGVDDAIDNCTTVPNPAQHDNDGDGYGNVCDGDLNQDGKIDLFDWKLFVHRFLTHHSDADLDGNGRVDWRDVNLAMFVLAGPLGPSQVTVKPENFTHPPIAEDLRIFSFEPAQADGRNVALFVRYADRRGGSEVLAPEGRVVILNDIGVAPDVTADDGVFSALTHMDLAANRASLKAFEARLARRGGTAQIGEFSGRELIGSRAVLPQAAHQAFIPLPDDLPLRPIPELDLVLPATSDAARSAMITDLSVVADPRRTYDRCDMDGDGVLGDPNGAWTFKTLVTHIANTPVTGITPQQLVHAWLKSFRVNDGPNARLNSTVIAQSPAFLMEDALLNHLRGWNPDDPSTLDLDSLPFRLLAIVNRLDLAQASAYGRASGGELRFVFGLLDLHGGRCDPAPMTVILEYGLPRFSCAKLRAAARAWLDLDHSHPAFPSVSYNVALQALTDPVTVANAAPDKPNGSAINQVRTNEQALDRSPWELQEFRLREGSRTSLLERRNLKQTPEAILSGATVLRDYINDHGAAVCDERHRVPRFYPPRPGGLGSNDPIVPDFPPAPAGAVPFLAAFAHYGPNTAFDAPGISGSGRCSATQVRHKFSLNTCSACHAAETATLFLHVDALTPAGLPARLSRFLTGTATTAPFTPVPDPANITPAAGPRHFNDLQRRVQILEQLATHPCLAFLRLPFLQPIH